MPRPLKAIELHQLARSAERRAERLRMNSYKLAEDGYTANLPAISKALDEAAKVSMEEGEALRQLNALWLAEGRAPLDLATVGGQVYRVASAGNPAVHMGAVLPEDEVESDRDALAERRQEYAASR